MALTVYGDLDISVIDELPPERLPVETHIIKYAQRESLYKKMQEEIDKGRQIYFVCPRIEETENENSNLHSVANERKVLDKAFPNSNIDCLHSRLKKDNKEKTIEKFRNGETGYISYGKPLLRWE